VDAEKRLLESAGVAVDQVLFDNAEIREARSVLADAGLAASAIWSRSATQRVRSAISRARPDVVHIHNTFAAASPAVFVAAHRAGIPVVHTLHNYRLVCPAATAFRDGRSCTDCVGHAVPWPGVVHACVRDSHRQSAVAAATLSAHRALGTYRERVSAYVALTEFQRDLIVAGGGLPADRIAVIPNFVDPDPGSSTDHRDGLLYVGRLSEEKGIQPLLAAARQVPGAVRIAGDGPLAQLADEAAQASAVEVLGRVAPREVLSRLRSSIAMLQPSICFEGFPVAVAEAYAAGTPVIASRIGSLAEVVEDGVTGLLAEPGDSQHLADRMRWALQHPDAMARMGLTARQRYLERFTGAAHLSALLRLYARVTAARHAAIRA
jgi:glycosyltransferase involved in cell wall biosynthesis